MAMRGGRARRRRGRLDDGGARSRARARRATSGRSTDGKTRHNTVAEVRGRRRPTWWRRHGSEAARGAVAAGLPRCGGGDGTTLLWRCAACDTEETTRGREGGGLGGGGRARGVGGRGAGACEGARLVAREDEEAAAAPTIMALSSGTADRGDGVRRPPGALSSSSPSGSARRGPRLPRGFSHAAAAFPPLPHRRSAAATLDAATGGAVVVVQRNGERRDMTPAHGRRRSS